jgi:linoleoyl-CoA desaturase
MKNKISYQKSHSGFAEDLKKRVRTYMQEEKIQRYAGSEMIWKALLLVCVYLTLNILPYFISFSFLSILCIGICSGFAKAVIGTGVMHDGNHGSASSKQKINSFLGSTLWLAGGDAQNWKMQHNMIHHTFTNVHEHDDDIQGHGLLRFSPHEKWKPIHRAQAFFAPFLYGLMTFLWVTTKDFSQTLRYNKRYKEGQEMYHAYKKVWKHLLRIGLIKILYWLVFFVLPLLFWQGPWWHVLVYFIAMHFTAGLFLGLVFQPAHVSRKTLFAEGLDTKLFSKEEHQIYTSCNFATQNPFLTWLVGGLNFQIEHHLFPNTSHVHYPKIAPLVKSMCDKDKIPYNEYPSFWSAIVDHFKFLHELGKKPAHE